VLIPVFIMDTLPAHLWCDVAQLCPNLSVAWLDASVHTSNVMAHMHKHDGRCLVTTLGLQRIANALTTWPRRGSTTNTWLQTRYRDHMAHMVVNRGDLAACRWLLPLGSFVANKLPDRDELLYWAAGRGHLHVLKWLVTRHPGLLTYETITEWHKNELSRELLYHVVEKGHVHIFDWLLQTNRFSWGNEFIDFQRYNNLRRRAARKGHLAMCQKLVTSYNSVYGECWVYVSTEAARKGHIHICQWALLKDVGKVADGQLEKWRGCVTALAKAACGYPEMDHKSGVCKNWRAVQWVHDTFASILFDSHWIVGGQWTISYFVSQALPAIMRSGSMDGVHWLEATYGVHECWPDFWRALAASSKPSTVFFDVVCSGNPDMCQWMLTQLTRVYATFDVSTLATPSAFLRAARMGHLSLLQWLTNTFPNTCSGLFPEIMGELVKPGQDHGQVFRWVMDNKRRFVRDFVPASSDRPAVVSVNRQHSTSIVYFLKEAIKHGHVDICRQLMDRLSCMDNRRLVDWLGLPPHGGSVAPPTNRSGAPNGVPDMTMALIRAIQSGNMQMCQFLAQHGAKPHEQLDTYMLDMMQLLIFELRHKKKTRWGRVATHQWALDTFGPEACQHLWV
jgi:hypothetical protein